MYRGVLDLLRNKEEKLWLFLFLFSSLASSFLYRLGSARVDKGLTPGMRDLGTYIDGGRNLLSGSNPYANPYVRIGPSGNLIIGILDSLFTEYLLSWIVLVSVPLGITYLVKILLALIGVRTKLHPWYLLIPWLSSVRENLVNIQITGIICLLFGIGLRLSFLSIKPLNIVLGYVCLALAIDSKPHLTALLFISLCVRFRRVKSIVFVFFIQAILHITLSMYNGHNLTLEWLKTILGLHNSAKNAELPESIAIWPILNKVGVSPTVTSIFSIICVVLLACHTLIFAIKWPTANTISLAFLAPSFGIFFHYYDLAPALTFCLVFQLATMPRLSSLAMLAIFIIPENFQDASSMSLLFTILMIYCLKIYLSRIKDVITYFLLALVSWLIYAVFVSVLSKFFGIHEIAVTCAIFLSTSVAFQQMKMSNH